MKLKYGYYDVFVRTCAKNPSGIAVRVYDNGKYISYTYSELYGVSEYVAQNIQQINCSKGIIGLVTDRNAVVPCLIAASHRCSTTFMFIDPSQDVEAIIKNAKLSIIIHVKDLKRNTAELFTKVPDKKITVFDFEINIYNHQPEDNQVNYNYVPKYSFIAVTSGSTGEPKFIQVPIQCIQPNVDDLTKLFNITPQDFIYFSTPLTFDPSMIEILLACINGASLLIAPEKADILFPENDENSVTFWQTTPSKFFQYSIEDIKNRILSAKSTLKVLALGGEPLNGIRRLRELKDAKNSTRIFTLYGVTEMSCWACVAELDLNKITNDNEIPLGNCLSETQLVVQKSNDAEVTGNIVLVSKTRKCTILNKSKSSYEEHFVESIDTGDVGEIKNGTIYYRGRKDDIIKRFGHKVSLQNIETTIMQCPRVLSCSCVWLPKPMLLVVYFTSQTLNSQELANFLKCKLDDKQWPDEIIRVENLPVNSHGKTSKRMLSQMVHEHKSLPHTLDCMNTLFMNELNLSLNKTFTYDKIQDKDFFSIGGTSFLAISMCNKLSLRYPELGKHILPYLVDQKYSIGKIMEVVSKTINIKKKKPRKRLKLSTPNNELSIPYDDCTAATAKQNVSKTGNYTILWAYNTGKCVDASPTLFKDGIKEYVTVGSHSGKIVVIDAISGVTQGVVTIASRVEASVVCSGGLSSPCGSSGSKLPSLCGSSGGELPSPCGIVGTYDGTVVCFTLQDCEEVWKINIGSMIKSKGIVCKGSLYVASYDGNVRNIDVLTGEIKDTIYIADQAISADLVLAKEEFLLVGTLSGVCACVRIGSKSVAWGIKLGSPIFASPVLYDNEKYVVFAEVNGIIHCHTVEKGIKIWEYKGAKGNIFSSMYYKEIDKSNWQMVFGCHDNNVYSVIITNCQPRLHWKTQLTSPVYSTPCYFGDKYIVAASNDGLICIINSENGSVVSEHRLPNEIFSSPVVSNDVIYIGCRDDCLYSIKCVI